MLEIFQCNEYMPKLVYIAPGDPVIRNLILVKTQNNLSPKWGGRPKTAQVLPSLKTYLFDISVSTFSFLSKMKFFLSNIFIISFSVSELPIAPPLPCFFIWFWQEKEWSSTSRPMVIWMRQHMLVRKYTC